MESTEVIAILTDDEECCIIDPSTSNTNFVELDAVVEVPSGFAAVEYMVPDESMPQAVCNIEDVYVSPICVARKNCLPPEVFGVDLGPDGDGVVIEDIVITQPCTDVFDHGPSASFSQIIKPDIDETEADHENYMYGTETDTYSDTQEVAYREFEPSETKDTIQDMNQDVNAVRPLNGEEVTGIGEPQSLLPSVKDEPPCDAVSENDVLVHAQSGVQSFKKRKTRQKSNIVKTSVKSSKRLAAKTKDHCAAKNDSTSDGIPTGNILKDTEFHIEHSDLKRKSRQQRKKAVAKKASKCFKTTAKCVKTNDLSSNDETNTSDVGQYDDDNSDPEPVVEQDSSNIGKELRRSGRTQQKNAPEQDMLLTTKASDSGHSGDANLDCDISNPEVEDISVYFETPLQRVRVKKCQQRPHQKYGNFSCETCSAGPFTTQRGLSRHMFYHENFTQIVRNGLYICPVCNMSFKKKSYLLKHRWDHTKSEIICSTCDKMFPSMLQLQSHKRRTHEVKNERYLCTICGKNFAQDNTLKRHLMCHKNKNLLLSMNTVCDDKSSKEVAKRDLQRHPCLACGKLFLRPIRWLHHMKIHLDQADVDADVKENIITVLEANKNYIVKTKVYICDVCGKINFYQAGHVLHMSKHTGDTPFGCKSCEKKFASLRVLHTHEREVHKPCGFKCCFCDKIFSRKKLLRTHKLQTHGELEIEKTTQVYNCNLCDYKAKLKARITFHKAQVHQVRDLDFVEHNCTLCSKSFATSYALQLHQNTHNKKKPYVCSICEKSYSDPSNLIHHGNKQHPDHPKELYYRPRSEFSQCNIPGVNENYNV